ncbi:T9SS type A sorting domain-containing protein [Tenacibaculum sp. 190524A02b]|uniref:T9SS type A sorting domain-containing protein n=1 Tax=Tenacibaculum vairaonense TaxID=3137860 RepID=UPI0031FAA2F1
MRKNYFFILLLVVYSIGAISQNVNIPDANFKNYLLGKSSINTNKDDEIQISEAIAFTGEIDCYGDMISDLTGIEEFVNLTVLDCANNQLTNLDLSKNIALQNIDCYRNQLTSLILPVTNTLKYVSCYENQLTNLDLSNNEGLKNISCKSNKLTNLVLPKTTILEKVNCDKNELTSLDVTANTGLIELDIDENKIAIIDLSQNTALNKFYGRGNYIRCIQVADVAVAEGKAYWYKSTLADYNTNCSFPAFVNVPDANFKTFLVASEYRDKNQDGEIDIHEAREIIDLNCSNKEIQNITGIEAFVNLEALRCYNNQLTKLDVSKNTKLKTLRCYDNLISEINISQSPLIKRLNLDNNLLSYIDISNNPNLTDLNCAKNGLTSLDLSKNTLLEDLYIPENQLASLDLSNNLKLDYLVCSDNLLTSLDITKNTLLERISLRNNQLTGDLDVSQNIKLEYIDILNNKVTNIDVTKNTLLEEILAGDNQISTIDFSKNLKLERVSLDENNITNLDFSNNKFLNYVLVSENKLATLNVKNGFNSRLTKLISYLNPTLTCIQVDNVSLAESKDWIKDATANYSVDCGYSVGVDEFLTDAITIGNNPVQDSLTINSAIDLDIIAVEVYNLVGKQLVVTKETEIDFRSFSKGMYLLKIETSDHKIALKKIIKE